MLIQGGINSCIRPAMLQSSARALKCASAAPNTAYNCACLVEAHEHCDFGSVVVQCSFSPRTQMLRAAKFATHSCSTAPPLEPQANHMSRIHLLACIRRNVESVNTTIHNASVTQRAKYQDYISASVNCDGSRVAADRAGLEGWPQLPERMVRYCLRCRFHAWIAMHVNQTDSAPPAHAAKATLTSEACRTDRC